MFTRGMVTLAVLGLALGGTASAQWDPGRDKVERLVEEIHRSGGYPDTLPRVSPRGGRTPSPGAGGRRSPAGRGTPPPVPVEPVAPPAEGSGSGWPLAMIALGVVLVVVLVWRRPARPAPPRQGEAAAAPRPGGTTWQKQEPQVLVEQRDWAEAIAALLYRSLRLTGWEPVGRDGSLTAREILARLVGDDPRRPHLRRVLALAEGVRFGGVTATESLFREVQAAFGLAEGSAPDGS